MGSLHSKRFQMSDKVTQLIWPTIFNDVFSFTSVLGMPQIIFSPVQSISLNSSDYPFFTNSCSPSFLRSFHHYFVNPSFSYLFLRLAVLPLSSNLTFIQIISSYNDIDIFSIRTVPTISSHLLYRIVLPVQASKQLEGPRTGPPTISTSINLNLC